MNTWLDYISIYELARLYKSIDRRIQFGRDSQLSFIKSIHGLLESNVPLLRGLRHIDEYGDSAHKQLISEMISYLSRGEGISKAMSDWYPYSVVQAVANGEKSGTLTETLNSIIDTYQMESAGVIKHMYSSIYPLLTIIAATISAILVDKFYITQLLNLSKDGRLSSTAEFIQWISVAVQSWGLLVLLSFVILIVFLKKYLSSDQSFRLSIQHLPIINIYSYLQGLRFLTTYSLLARVNIRERKIFELLQVGASPFMKWHFNKMLENLQVHSNIAKCIDTGLLPKEATGYLVIVAGAKKYHDALIESYRKIYEIIDRTILRGFIAFKLASFIYAGIILIAIVLTIMSKPQLNIL